MAPSAVLITVADSCIDVETFVAAADGPFDSDGLLVDAISAWFALTAADDDDVGVVVDVDVGVLVAAVGVALTEVVDNEVRVFVAALTEVVDEVGVFVAALTEVVDVNSLGLVLAEGFVTTVFGNL